MTYEYDNFEKWRLAKNVRETEMYTTILMDGALGKSVDEIIEHLNELYCTTKEVIENG